MPENITERQHEKVGSNHFVPLIFQTLTKEDYREAVSNIRVFFELLDKWESGLDAANGPSYDKLRDKQNEED